jgi:hypothetical protein
VCGFSGRGTIGGFVREYAQVACATQFPAPTGSSGMTTVGQSRSRSSKAMTGLWNPTGTCRFRERARSPRPLKRLHRGNSGPRGVTWNADGSR